MVIKPSKEQILSDAKLYARNAKISLAEGDLRMFSIEFKEMRRYLYDFKNLVTKEGVEVNDK